MKHLFLAIAAAFSVTANAQGLDGNIGSVVTGTAPRIETITEIDYDEFTHVGMLRISFHTDAYPVVFMDSDEKTLKTVHGGEPGWIGFADVPVSFTVDQRNGSRVYSWNTMNKFGKEKRTISLSAPPPTKQ